MLLVSCHFPPDPSIGALRWQRMARFAAARGWAMDVIMLAPSEVRGADPTRLSELPPGTRLFGVPTPSRPMFSLQHAAWKAVRRLVSVARPAPASGASSAAATSTSETEPAPGANGDSSLHRLRRSFLTSAAFRKGDAWTRRAVRRGVMLARETRYDCVVSSGPPHMAHEAARQIAALHGIPFVMDMRDPWCDVDAMPPDYSSARWLQLAGTYEARCVRAAALVVANTSAAEQALRRRYPDLADRFITVMNGADEDPLPNAPPGERFIIAFAGTLYVGRDPGNLFRGIARAIDAERLTPAELSVEFMGSEGYGNIPLTERARAAGIDAFFTAHGTRPRSEALAFLARASMLVNLPQDVRLAVPAKLFEYVRFPAWLLVLTEPGTATDMLFAGTEADVVGPDDVDAIARVVRRHYHAFRRDGRPAPLNASGSFDRRVQAAKLLDALDRVTAVAPKQ